MSQNFGLVVPDGKVSGDPCSGEGLLWIRCRKILAKEIFILIEIKLIDDSAVDGLLTILRFQGGYIVNDRDHVVPIRKIRRPVQGAVDIGDIISNRKQKRLAIKSKAFPMNRILRVEAVGVIQVIGFSVRILIFLRQEMGEKGFKVSLLVEADHCYAEGWQIHRKTVCSDADFLGRVDIVGGEGVW